MQRCFHYTDIASIGDKPICTFTASEWPKRWGVIITPLWRLQALIAIYSSRSICRVVLTHVCLLLKKLHHGDDQIRSLT